ncbi:MAG: efflux RND transporter periplasmic adaptor subunit, partial [Phycisphaerales bacterium]|nr:efflux RND transporter periplasmic adaptor subunit [Phycisphaerales bacterium]
MLSTRIFAIATAWTAIMLGPWGCGGSSDTTKATQAPPPAPVTAVKALGEDIPDFRYYPAITQAVLEAEIVARVEGYLEQRDFIEGDDVVAGQRLYLIQQEEYVAGLIQAKAALANAEAELEFDRYTFKQTTLNYEGGGGTVYEVDEARASLLEAEANVEAARAQVLNAELDLSYTEVIAPFNGRMSETDVNIGNLVGSGATAEQLATLVMLDPMRVIFEPAGTELVQFLEASSSTVPVQITVRETGGEQQIFNGALDLVNNTVN